MAAIPGQGDDNNLFDDPLQIVKDQVTGMNTRADNALATANALIDQLSAADDLPTPPSPPTYDDTPGTATVPGFTGTAPDANLFGSISDPSMPADPGNGSDLIGDISFDDIVIPTFDPSVSGINIPDAPTPSVTGDAPDAPDLAPVDVPSVPDIAIPELGELNEINIPAFEFPTLPTFDAVAPTFESAEPDTSIDYSEDGYASENLDAIKAEVATLLQGGTGIPKAVEEAIFARSVERAEAQADADTQAAFDTYAGRGWDMPPGMLAASVRAAREAKQERVAEARRDLLVQASQFEIENLRFAVQQGLAIEQALMNVYDNAQQRALRMAELRQQADMALYNAHVSLFNARQQAYQVQAQVFEQRLNAALSKLEVYRTQIEGQKAIGELNQQKVDAYKAQVAAVRERVGIFTARIQGAELQSRAQSNQIERYKAEVEAYGRKIDADKSRYDAYEARVRGESAKADIVSSEARAFASTIEGLRSKSSIKVEQIRARLSAVGAATERFQAKVAAERDFAAAQASALQAKAQAYSADVSRYSAEVDADRSRNELEARVNQDKVRNALAFYETQVKNYDAILQRMNQQAGIKVQSVSAAGQMASQLAAGAMSAINIGANVSGSASESSSRSESYTHYFEEEGGLTS